MKFDSNNSTEGRVFFKPGLYAHVCGKIWESYNFQSDGHSTFQSATFSSHTLFVPLC